MRNYLDYAENQAQELGYIMNGVRVYYGAYSEGDTSDHAGQATMFIVPTGTNDSGTNRSAANGDIPGANGLNEVEGGEPPAANYPL